MENLFIYFAKIIFISAVFWLYYLAFLRGKEFHHYNRFYLLITSVFSLALPLLKVDWFTIQPSNKMLYNAVVLFNGGASNVEFTQQSNLGFWEYAGMGLGIISVFLVLKFGVSVFKIQQIKNKYPKEKYADYTLVLTDLDYAPFTFLKNLFWNKTINTETENGNKILRHELTHIKEKHTLDRVYLQILKSIFWFNPIFYLINREIALIHEYLADQKAIANHDTKAFAEMLLSQHYTTMSLQGTSPFFSSTIKKRLEMLTKKHNTKFSYARRVWALPLLFALSFIYLVQAKNREIKIENEKIESTINTIGENTNSIEKVTPIENDTILSAKIKEILDKYKNEKGIPDLSNAPDEERKLLFSYLSEQRKSLKADSLNIFEVPNFVVTGVFKETLTQTRITNDSILPRSSKTASISISNGKLKSKNIDWNKTLIYFNGKEVSKKVLDKKLSENSNTKVSLSMNEVSPNDKQKFKGKNRIVYINTQNIETPPIPATPPTPPSVNFSKNKLKLTYSPNAYYKLAYDGKNGTITSNVDLDKVKIIIDGKNASRKELESLIAKDNYHISMKTGENLSIIEVNTQSIETPPTPPSIPSAKPVTPPAPPAPPVPSKEVTFAAQIISSNETGKLKLENISEISLNDNSEDFIILLNNKEISKEKLDKLDKSSIVDAFLITNNDKIKNKYGKKSLLNLSTKSAVDRKDIMFKVDDKVASYADFKNLTTSNINSIKVIKAKSEGDKSIIEIQTK